MKMTVTEFKARCTSVLREVETHPYTVEVTRRGRVVAVVAAPQQRPRKTAKEYWGSMNGTVAEMGDILAPAVKSSEWEACR